MQQRVKYEMLASVLVAVLSGGCARQPPLSSPPVPAVQQKSSTSLNLAWARNDGQLISASPELTAQARKDISECGAAIPPVSTSQGIAGEDCMKARDYHVREVP
jgi:hypothetical protein